MKGKIYVFHDSNEKRNIRTKQAITKISLSNGSLSWYTLYFYLLIKKFSLKEFEKREGSVIVELKKDTCRTWLICSPVGGT